MSEKVDTVIKFNLDNFNGVQSCDTNKEQPEANHYRKIQNTNEGQELIRELANVINNIGNIDGFTNALRQYIAKYAIFKEKNSSTNFKIRDIKFTYNNREDATLNEIIITTFNGNNELIQLYGRIIDQFDRVCEDLDKVFNIQHNLNSFETFMNDLSLETISPLTIELCNQIINNQINEISKNISTQCKTSEYNEGLNACKNKFINLQNGTQVVRKELRQLSNESEDSAFKSFNGKFKKDSNYLPLVKDEYNRNYLHYAWKHFEDVSAQNGFLEKIKTRLLQYAGNNTENIKQACQEKDVYGLTPLCYVLINAFDDGFKNPNVSMELKYILNYFKYLGVSTQLNQEELQAIYDYFKITNNAQGQQQYYQEFINTMNAYIQKTHNGKIPYVQKSKIYKPQIKYKAQTNKEQMQSNEVSVETFLSDGGVYKDKVGGFVDSLFGEIYNTSSQIGEDSGSDKYKQYYMDKEYNKIYNNIASIYANKINSIKQDEKLKYISNDSTYNTLNRNNYCISLFIKALEQKYGNTNNPDIMFKFLSDFCEKDMNIKMSKDNYIQVIKYFLDNPIKINDDVKQNIKSLTRYMIENGKIRNFSFIQEIRSNRSFNENAQVLIQDIVLTAIDNNLSFSGGNEISTPQQLVQELCNCGFSDNTSSILGATQQNLSTFTIVKNLILSGNITENEDFSRYNGLNNGEKAKLQQILAKTVAVTKIIREGKQDCSKLKDAVVKFVSGNIGLTIEDIEKIKINHKSIADFCEGEISTNKKCAYYSWFLNKLVVNNYIANNPSSNTIERSSGSRTTLLPGNEQQTTTLTNIIMDTYEEFENYKNNTVKKNKQFKSHEAFQTKYMRGFVTKNTITSKRSRICYQDINSVYNYEQQFNNSDYDSETSKTLKGIVSNGGKDDIQTDLKNYKLQQQVNTNKEKSEEFKKFCTVFDLIRANTLLFNAIKGINATTTVTRSQRAQGDYDHLD